jgi:maltose O-acetyltransferase
MIKEVIGVLAYYMPPPLNKYLHILRGVNIKQSSSVWIGLGSLLDNKYPNKISIGKNVTISVGVQIFAHTEPPITIQKNYMPMVIKEVIIGDNIFIGAGSCILPGVTIGNDVIIGAHSVVTKDIPSYSLCVGNPAKVIKDVRELKK